MGNINCSNCGCNSKEELEKKEFQLGNEQEYGQERRDLKTPKDLLAASNIVSPNGLTANGQRGSYSDKNMKQHLRKIIKVQAWWRGTQARKLASYLKEHQRAASKYFTVDESRETISNDVYNPNMPREKRPEYKFKTGALYKGEWRGGFRDGFGEQVWPDGARYIGDWKHNRAHGRGKFIHVDGDYYDGEWKNDKANGKGTYVHVNGARYEGMWKDDLQHGMGVETWTDGARYEGDYVAGKKHGKGLYKWNDGSEYNGEWVENKISGFGVYKWLDGRTYRGEWKNNNMDGYGIYTWKDGRKYEGQYKDDKKHGFGIYIWADGRKYEGWWHMGKQHGLGKYLVPSEGKEKHGIWEDGRRKEWFDDKMVELISGGSVDYCSFFQNEVSSLYVNPKAGFTAPPDFRTKIEVIRTRTAQ